MEIQIKIFKIQLYHQILLKNNSNNSKNKDRDRDKKKEIANYEMKKLMFHKLTTNNVVKPNLMIQIQVFVSQIYQIFRLKHSKILGKVKF